MVGHAGCVAPNRWMSRSPDGLRFVGGLLPGQLATSVMNPIVFSETDAEAEGK